MNKSKMMLAGILVVFAFSSVFGQISNIQVSNLTSSSATITWTTSDSTDGCVHYGLTTALGDMACDPRSNDDVHYVFFTGLSAETTYYFEVVSGGVTDNNGGAYYTFTTAEMGSGGPYVIFGYVQLSDSINPISCSTFNKGVGVTTPGTPAMGTIVSLWIKSAGNFSYSLSDLTNSGGVWSLNLGNLKNPADGAVFSYNAGDSIYVDAQGAADGGWQVKTTVSGSGPHNTGNMVIGLLRGDFNNDGKISSGDVVCLLNYLYRNGTPPDPLAVADANCDGKVSSGDIVVILNYLYRNGPPLECW